MSNVVKVCPMAQAEGCLLDKCLFFDSTDVLCIFMRQHLKVLETHLLSGVALQSSLGYHEISAFLNERFEIAQLTSVVQAIAVYLEYLRKLQTSPDVTDRYRKQLKKIYSDLRLILEDHLDLVHP